MKHAPTASRTATPLANAPLWAFAARMLAKMVDWFGSPGEMAVAGFVNARFVWDIMPWFQRLEGLVRRLVIAQAVAMGPCLRGLGLRIGAPRAIGVRPPRSGGGENRTLPAMWSVRFRIGLRGGGPRSFAPPPLAPRTGPRVAAAPLLSEPRTIPTPKLARRLEAVSRVVADPLLCARRLAARLARTPALAARLRKPRPRIAPDGPFRDSYPDLLRQAHQRMTAALDAFESGQRLDSG